MTFLTCSIFILAVLVNFALANSNTGQAENETLLKAVAVVDPPYVYKNSTCFENIAELKKKNKYHLCYYGFVVDLLFEIQREVQFNFTIDFEEKVYGVLESENWNGAIGLLKDKKVDFGMAAFSITTDRENVVDFSKAIVSSTNSTYALAFTKGFTLTKKFNRIIEKLTNQRYLEQLTETWFNENPELDKTKLNKNSLH